MSLRSLRRKLILRSRGLFDVEKGVACASQLNIALQRKIFPKIACMVLLFRRMLYKAIRGREFRAEQQRNCNKLALEQEIFLQ